MSPVVSNALILDIYVKFPPPFFFFLIVKVKYNPCSSLSLSVTSKLDRVSDLYELILKLAFTAN